MGDGMEACSSQGKRSRKRPPLSQISLSEVSMASQSKRPKLLDRRAGTILRMSLKNFMCHSLLNVDLSKNVNLIVGRNGSGKSAILTALIVGLGGKASLTNRGNSVKNFIKAGKNSCSVEIELYNGGPMAYKPAVYGDRITIVRHFNANGGSSYVIKSDKGAVKSRAFREVTNITTALYIQVDNPVCVLNQDTSRNFLMSNNPKHKFQLFMKATKLDTLAEEYRKMNVNRNEAMRSLEQKQDNYKKLVDEMNAVQTKIDNHKSIVGIKEQLRGDRCELLWAEVRDCQAEIEKAEEKVAMLEGKHAEAVDASKNRASKVEKIKEHIKELKQQMDQFLEQLSVARRAENDQKAVIQRLESTYNEKRLAQGRLNTTVATKTHDRRAIEEQIAGVNESTAQAERVKLERARDLARMKEKLKTIEDLLATSTNELHMLQNDAEVTERQQHIRQEVARLDREIRNESSTLQALKKESGNNLLLYGRDMPAVVQMIEANRKRFKQMPRGPLGNYVKLKEKKWAMAIEGFLTSRTLGAFAVDNVQDNAVLQEILNRCWTQGARPNIITSRFINRNHDIRQNVVSVPNGCANICDCLDIEDPVVFNCLIDQSSMESILLLPSGEKAVELMSNLQRVPRNCGQGITVTGDIYYPMPRYRTYASNYSRPKYLQVDTKEYIVQLEAKIEELESKKAEAQTELRRISAEISTHATLKSELEVRVKRLLTAKVQARKQIDQLNVAAEPEVASIEFLESELIEVKAAIKTSQAELATVEEEMRVVKADIEREQQKLRELKDVSAGINTRILEFETEIQEQRTRQGEIATGDEYDKRKVSEIDTKLGQARVELVAKNATLTQLTNKAAGAGEKVDTDRSIDDIVQEITKLERAVERIQTSSVNVEELTQSFREMREKAANVKSLLELVQNDIAILNQNVAERSRHYKITEDYFRVYVQQTFQSIMAARQFEGSIVINMLNETLDMNVIPQHGSQGLTTTSNLSGGERSFSTVAFLYSLWQCMEFPFYFLDEFDVFMDKLNRGKVIEILIHHALEHHELQYVFLTPQDVPAVKADVRILKLDDPERIPV